MNALLKLSPVESAHAVLSNAPAIANQRSLQRLLQSLFREQILNTAHIISEAGVSWLPLWPQQAMLRMEGLRLGRASHCTLAGPLTYYRHGQRPLVIRNGSELLAMISVGTDLKTDDTALQTVYRELDNSQENDALCASYRYGWGAELRAQIRAGGAEASETLLDWLRQGGHPAPCLFLEQWGCIGHPFHPAHKSKSGLDGAQVLAYSPEFRPEFHLTVAAARRDALRISMMNDDDYTAWFAQRFPVVAREWERSLRNAGLRPEEWLPLPLHPYQASVVIPIKFAADIANGDLIVEHMPQLAATPTLSLRTVAASTSTLAPHLKLPLSLQLTSAQRTVSARATVMGPRLSTLLTQILQQEPQLRSRLAILCEECGVVWRNPERERTRHLSLLYRSNPMQFHNEQSMPIPVAALFADSPLDGRALICEILRLSGNDHGAGALAYFQHYAQSVLHGCLGIYLRYGIAFEAHQQNSLIVLDHHYRIEQVLLRDFGDLRIHAPSLAARGYALSNEQSGVVLFDDAHLVRDKFIHATLFCHLAELGILLADSYRQDQDCYWHALAHQCAAAFEHWQPHCDQERWHNERFAILQADWPVKSLLRMRLANTSDDLCVHMANPLAPFLGLASR